MSHIAIVGGGASAVCLLDALAQAEIGPAQITLFEPSPGLWRGRPFQEDTETVCVNAPPEEMSIRFGDGGHFERWLTARDLLPEKPVPADDHCGSRFVPRRLYGDYLEQSASAALMQLIARGWEFRLAREVVVVGEQAPGGLVLTTESGERVHADRAVLCVGGGCPADPYGLTGAPGFVSEPYPLNTTLKDIDPRAEVAVIGSGLTGVDVVLSLAARGHRGRIRLRSRGGVLPGVRQRPVPYDLKLFTPEHFRAAAARGDVLTLEEMVARMRAEFAEAGATFAPVEAELAAFREESHPVARLRRNLADVDDPSLALRILQRAVPETGPDLWPLLCAEDKAEVLRHHYRALMSLCCPMPPASAAGLLELVDRGQLEITGGLQDVETLPDGQFGITSDEGITTADTVISAVNAPAHKLSPRARPLVASLENAGLARRHPRGGVHVERATSRTTVDGVPERRLYALGDLAAGSLFFTFGVPSLVDRAYDIVASLRDDERTTAPRREAALQTA